MITGGDGKKFNLKAKKAGTKISPIVFATASSGHPVLITNRTLLHCAFLLKARINFLDIKGVANFASEFLNTEVQRSDPHSCLLFILDGKLNKNHSNSGDANSLQNIKFLLFPLLSKFNLGNTASLIKAGMGREI